MISFRSSRVLVSAEEEVPWTLDGEYGGSPADVTIENLPRALTIHLPVESLRPKK